ncbi:MAG: hypothetical protein A3G18_08280 [Rhodospirillales bacterium RIFCSPLOWO2_12_FULL_58_28]|nr:MAG: hypothetical protein A3H92_09655 [Rhodospirillales bacterium RIFCSPLOWO2_02_FULL_58_16]OHC79135.1 MAG: hypothetical protein A3G18_08280 [Rhodospirillales bacterium RIFCSPLOWO2_12_FULL_58_28]
MPDSEPIDFYASGATSRTYVAPVVKRKHRRQFDDIFWRPAECRSDMSFLEIGCGSGLFLAYLKEKGARDVVGVDQEKRVKDYMPPDLAAHVLTTTVDDYLCSKPERTFHRVAMFDVFEHFPPEEGVALLERLRRFLTPDGRIVIRVPNMSSPWGPRHHFGDLTHRAAYTPDSLRQAAAAAGYELVQSLPVRRGRTLQRFLQRPVEKLAGLVLTESPKIWTATFVAVLAPRCA